MLLTQIKVVSPPKAHFVAMQQKQPTALSIVTPPRGSPEAGQTLRSHCDNCQFQELTGATRSPEGILAPLCRVAAETSYVEDDCVARLGDRRDQLVTLQEGILRLSRSQADGRRHIGGFLFKGDIVGFGEPDAIWSFDLEAVTPARLCVLAPRRDHGAEPRPDRLYRKLFEIARRQAERAEQHAALLALPSPIDRLAGFLLELDRRHREASPCCARAEQHRRGGLVAIRIAMRRADIADYLGLTIETVSRSFRRMVNAGLIRLPHPKQVLVPDLDRLEALIGELPPRPAVSA